MTSAGSSCTLRCAMTRGSHGTFGLQSTNLTCLAYASIPLAFGFTSLASCAGSGTFLGCAFSICRQSCGDPLDILPVISCSPLFAVTFFAAPFVFFGGMGEAKSTHDELRITYHAH
jgi:hypothetical protein